jgi:superfamily II DNA or RNA helicase
MLLNDPLYRDRIRQAWLWADWPGRWGADNGIDVVAETIDGEFWAVQSKAYNPRNSVTKGDIDSFLAEAGRGAFSFRLLVATTDHVNRNARSAIDGQRIPSAYRLLAELRTSLWPKSMADLANPVERKEREGPRPYQTEAVEAVIKAFESHDRGQLIMACGTGKTLVALFVSEKLESRKILVLVPSLMLLKQTMTEWAVNAEFSYDTLAVCSDITAGDDDAPLEFTGELGVPVTTTPNDIAARLTKDGPVVVFCTYQSSPRVAEAVTTISGFAFDIVIVDEAHRCAGAVGGEFTTVLNQTLIPARRRLFMTATPRRLTNRIRNRLREADLDIASMDDESKFGPVFHNLSFHEAIKRGLLTDYQIVVMGISNEMHRDWVRSRRYVSVEGGLIPESTHLDDAGTLAAEIGLLMAMRDYGMHRVISFHSRVKTASAFAENLPRVKEWANDILQLDGPLWAGVVHGAMTTGERGECIKALKATGYNEYGVLTNARCLSEGVDVPTLDGVAFIDPRGSEVDIVQAVGRAIRLSERKKIGTIFLPVFLGEDEDPAAELPASTFKTVWAVLRALRAYDTVLGEELDGLRRGMGAYHSVQALPGKIIIRLPEKINLPFAEEFRTMLVENTTEAWEFAMGRLFCFVSREGNGRVPKRHVEDGFNLGVWVVNQRRIYRAGGMTPDHISRLEEVPGWVWDVLSDVWEKYFDLLEKFISRIGSSVVPKMYVEDNIHLGQWVSNQRAAYRRGRLPPLKITRLEALSGWSWNTHKDDWEEGFAHLEKFVNSEGNALVPNRYKDPDDDFHLGQWVISQRRTYLRGAMTPERGARLLTQHGWAWDAVGASWEKGFIHLENYISLMETALVPNKYVDPEDKFPLGKWVSHQRGSHTSGKLLIDKIKRLEDLSGWTWSKYDAAWEDGFIHLEKFIAAKGNAQVSQPYCDPVDGYKLGMWISNQRATYKRKKLEQSKIGRLEDLSGWLWSVPDGAWEDGFIHLEKFISINKNARVPSLYVDPEDGFPLGNWVSTQRGTYKCKTLAQSKIELLEERLGWAWNTFDALWEEGFEHLMLFTSRENHVWVPTSYRDPDDGHKLGVWVGSQHTRYGNGSLTKERVNRLEAVPGWAWRSSPKP